MRLRSLRARLVAGTVACVLVGFVMGGAALSLAFRRTVEDAFEKRLDSLLVAVIGTLEVPPAGPVHVSRPIADNVFERPYSGWYWQIDDGAAQVRSRSLWDAVLPIGGQGGTVVDERRVRGPRDQMLRLRVRSLRYPSRLHPVVAAVAGPESEVQAEIHRFDRLLMLSLGALALSLGVVLAVQLGYGLQPLRGLAAELAAVRAGRTPRLRGDYPTEVRPLVDAMNDVLDHDAGLIARARTHVGNLAHALKTPLAVLTNEAARLPSSGIAPQVAVMNRLVDHHLARAASAGPRRVPGARTDVGAVARAIRDTLLRLYAGRGIAIEVAVPAGTMFAGERQDLEELLGTVLDNACKWAATRVVFDARGVAGRMHLTVEDDGPGLDAEQAEQALTRGARLDDDTPGSGLGLAIATDLAELYGGTLTLARSDLGGLRVHVELPVADESSAGPLSGS